MAHGRGGLRAPRTGVVSEFDERRGLGAVLGDDGRSYPFHCTALVDGTRDVAVGTRVLYCVEGGHGGRYEARAITSVPAG